MSPTGAEPWTLKPAATESSSLAGVRTTQEVSKHKVGIHQIIVHNFTPINLRRTRVDQNSCRLLPVSIKGQSRETFNLKFFHSSSPESFRFLKNFGGETRIFDIDLICWLISNFVSHRYLLYHQTNQKYRVLSLWKNLNLNQMSKRSSMDN